MKLRNEMVSSRKTRQNSDGERGDGETEREGSRKNFIEVYIKETSAEDSRGGPDVEQNSTAKERRQNSDEGTGVVMECAGENCIHQVHERHVESLWKRRGESRWSARVHFNYFFLLALSIIKRKIKFQTF